MSEPPMEKIKRSPKRVFLNNMDSYPSRTIAKLLVEPAVDEEEEAQTFQVVGTVSDRSNEDRPRVLEDAQPDRDDLLSKLMTCHVVIYDVSRDAEQLEEAAWAVTALHSQMDLFSGPKIFILVSTVMTWASSKPLDPDDPLLPFTDEVFWIRRAHPSFTRHIDLEKRVVQLGKSNRALFSTYVVASGLQYGMGEQIFHHFFKTAWLGQEKEVSVFGDGKNIVPTIHVSDLTRVLRNVIEHQPRPSYLLAVDSSNNTLEDIVKAVSSALGSGRIQKRPAEDIFLAQDWSVMEISSLQVNLRMEAVNIRKLFSLSWLCESGLVENVDLVVEEYRQNRSLMPLRLCVLGPPAVGKTTVSKRICQRYRLHHVTLKDAVSEAVSQLEETVRNSDPDVDHVAPEAQELLASLKDSGDNVPEEQMKVLRDKLMSNPCRNQGFVLEDFPASYQQAKDFFGEEPDGWSPSRRILPEFVLCLEAPDSLLTGRVMDLPERLLQQLDYEPENFLKELAAYREKNTVKETAVDYFEDLNISPLFLEVTSSEEKDLLLMMEKIFDTVGPPRTISPSSQEVEEEERRKAEEKMRREVQERAEEEQREKEEARSRTERWDEWTQTLEQTRQQEEQELEDLTVPMRSYLMERVMPTLTQGLIECCRTQPPDPVDFLVEYLLKKDS